MTAYEAAEQLVDELRKSPDPEAAISLLLLARLLTQRVLVPNDLVAIASGLRSQSLVTTVRDELFKAIASHGRRSDGQPPAA
jgi:trehalose-6-phosphatase